jgi:dihydrofolate reductase
VAKVVLAMITSIDGFISGPNDEMDWMFPHIGPELQQNVVASLQQTDTILVGRRTYEGMAATWPNQSNPLADLMNALPKVVFSTTLDKTEWNNSRLATGSAEDEIRQLKQEATKDIKVAGGAGLAQSLTRLGLIDEYNLVMVPVVLGRGRPLFTEQLNLSLSSSEVLDGAIVSVYSRA